MANQYKYNFATCEKVYNELAYTVDRMLIVRAMIENMTGIRDILKKDKATLPKDLLALNKQLFDYNRELGNLEMSLKSYQVDEVFLYSKVLAERDETKCLELVKDGFEEMVTSRVLFNPNEDEQERAERVYFALYFLLGYLYFSGRTTEALLVQFGGDFGMGAMVGLLITRIADKKAKNGV